MSTWSSSRSPASAWGDVLPRRLRPLAHLRPDGRPQLRARRVHHVGAYAAWWLTTAARRRRPSSALPPRRRSLGLAVAALVAALVELVLIRPLYRRPVEQVLVTVGLALALGALVVGIWGTDPSRSRIPAGCSTRRRPRSEHPERPLRGDRRRRRAPRPDGSSCATRARARHPRWCREPRDGARARDRRAPRVHARVRARRLAGRARRRPLGVYFGIVDPHAARRLLIFAFIVVVIGGFGSIIGSAIAAVAVGLVQQYANYYVATRLHRRPRGRAPARPVLLLRPKGRLRTRHGRGRLSHRRAARAVSRCSRVVPFFVWTSSSAARLDRRDAPAARALPPVRGRRAHLRPLFGFTGPALVRARALLRARRVRAGDRA